MSSYPYTYQDADIIYDHRAVAICWTYTFAKETVHKLNAFDDLLDACAVAHKLLAEMARSGNMPDTDSWCETQQKLSNALGVATGKDMQELKAHFKLGQLVSVDGFTFEIFDKKSDRGRLYVRGINTIWFDTGCINA